MEKLNELSEWLSQDGIVWVKYNPIVAATLAVISLVFCFLTVRLAKKRKQKKVAPVSEYERAISDRGITMSTRVHGRIVPNLRKEDSIKNNVRKILDVNHHLESKEVAELLIEGGIDIRKLGDKEYYNSLVYACMQSLSDE